MSYTHFISLLITLTLGGIPALANRQPGDPPAVTVKLTEWKVELSERSVAAGTVTFSVANTGTIPHAFEIEGQGIERETAVIQPGASATLTLQLKPGSYEVYCPVGQDSHKKLGMEARLTVGGSSDATDMSAMGESHAMGAAESGIRVTGGGPVIQILPGPFPFPDSAAPILAMFGAEREGLESQIQNGPYSNNVAPSSGT